MTVFILVFILLVAVLVIALLMGVSPASQKVKVWTMYICAALVLFAAPIICNYIDALPTSASKLRFQAILVFAIAIGYFCVYIACMEKYNVLKRKNRVLEQALTEKEQEKVAAIMEHQNEKQQSIYNPQIQIFAESETKRPFFECSFKTKRTKKDLRTTQTIKPEIRAKITLFRAWALSSTIQQAI